MWDGGAVPSDAGFIDLHVGIGSGSSVGVRKRQHLVDYVHCVFVLRSFALSFLQTRVFFSPSYLDMFLPSFRPPTRKRHGMLHVTRLVSWCYGGVTHLLDLAGGSRLPLPVRRSRCARADALPWSRVRRPSGLVLLEPHLLETDAFPIGFIAFNRNSARKKKARSASERAQ